MRGLRVVAALSLLLAAALPARAAGSDEAALRKRVERFYVLSYLNRYGEMWDIFTPELQRRLGGDKHEYIRTSRQAGFELFASRIESVSVQGAGATVDVAIQAQLPGNVGATWRRHRMAWKRDADEGWLYAGSLDITSQEHAVEGQDLLPIPKAPSIEEAPAEKLPLRERVTPAEAPAPREPVRAAAPRTAEAGERWDLVAVPPPGSSAPVAPAPVAVPDERASAAPVPAPATAPPAKAPRAPAMLPPERASPPAAASAPAPAPARAEAASAGDEEPLDTLVRRAVESSGMRRLRALGKIRDSSEPRLAGLLAQGLPKAPPASAIVFLDKLAVLGNASHAPLALPSLDAEEPELRRAAFGALAELGGTGQIGAVTEAFAREALPAPRIAGLRALGALGKGDARAATLVAQAVGDAKASDAEREAAARAAGQARMTEAEPALLRILHEGRPASAFVAAIAAAGRLATPACVKALEDLVDAGGVVTTGTRTQPVALLAARALVTAEAPGAGAGLSRVMLLFADDAQIADTDAVAETGDDMALVALLAHPRTVVTMRAAELIGRTVDSPEDAARTLPALDRALVESNDPDVLVAIQRARERLTALAGRR